MKYLVKCLVITHYISGTVGAFTLAFLMSGLFLANLDDPNLFSVVAKAQDRGELLLVMVALFGGSFFLANAIVQEKLDKTLLNTDWSELSKI